MTKWPENIQGGITNILDLDKTGVETTITVETTLSARSLAFFLPAHSTFSWEVQFESSGLIDVKIELEQQFPKVNESDGEEDFVVPDNKVAAPMFSQVNDANTHQVSYSPITSLYARLKLTGQGSNDATTELTKARMYVARN